MHVLHLPYNYYIPIFILFQLLLTFQVNLTQAGKHDKDNDNEEVVSTLVQWIKSKGGKINSKLEISTKEGNRIFATKDIPNQAVLFKIPHEIIVSGGIPKVGDKVSYASDNDEDIDFGVVQAGPNEDDLYEILFDDGVEEDIAGEYLSKYTGRGMECETVRNLIEEKNLGDESDYAPYINYLFSRKVMLPSAWSKEGQELLSGILGKTIAPSLPFVWDYPRVCKQGKEEGRKAGWIQVQYAKDDLFIPFYDMMRHRNGNDTNAEISSKLHYNADVVVRALRDINQGDEIFISKNLCKTCRQDEYGTAELLRDGGFVEQGLQSWYLDELGVSFELGQGGVRFLSRTEREGMWRLEGEAERLEDWDKKLITFKDKVIEEEYKIIDEYFQSIRTALRQALTKDSKECITSECSFDKLQPKADTLDYVSYTCQFGRDMIFPQHDFVQEVKTPYQNITLYQHTENKDTCFSLDGIVQICGSYRPHYHEMVVHYAARFLPVIRRVVFVGGGDSMLLHEIMKYPSLELVVGLEIDQTVTRKSFEHFGTQPHWNNPKVQWYYGDAAKSLLMLPQSYFNSFDLVLVDLSETVMSMTVTKHLDIMSALGLLLKPNGIFVKNELYLEKLDKVFEYVVQLHYYDVPVICSQALILGSNGIDFMKEDMVDHGVEILWEDHFTDLEDKEIWHDYRRNVTYSKVCLEEEEEMEEQEKSPGIIMILEIEEVGYDVEGIRKVIASILSTHGLNVRSSVTYPIQHKMDILVTFFQQGYIQARSWFDNNYVAFDIHLWSAFDKLPSIQHDLQMKLRSTKTSSYRIVAGGMFGVASWREDESKRGPNFHKACEKNEEKPSKSLDGEVMDEGITDSILEKSIDLILDDEITVGVVCGLKSQSCPSLDIAKNHAKVSNAVPLYACATIDTTTPSDNALRACENELANILKQSTLSNEQQPIFIDLTDKDVLSVGDRVMARLTSKTLFQTATIQLINPDGTINLTYDNRNVMQCTPRSNIQKFQSKDVLRKKIRAIILDSSAPFVMGQILHKIMIKDYYRTLLFTTNIFLISLWNPTSIWRRQLLDRFRHDIIIHDPVFRAQVLFHTDNNKSLEMGVSSSGDLKFVQHFKNILSLVSELHPQLQIDIRNIQGGEFYFQPHFTPSMFALPENYDRTLPLEQWNNQVPLGRQTIFQLEKKTSDTVFRKLSPDDDPLSIGDKVVVDYMKSGEFYSGRVRTRNKDETYYIKYDDGDEENGVEVYQIRVSFQEPLSESDSILSHATIINALTKLSSSINQVCASSDNQCSQDIQEYTHLGEGSVSAMMIPNNGNIIVLWDGRGHVDMNVFTLDQSEDLHKNFVTQFLKDIPCLALVLHDTQPRGMGGVVNFEKDIGDDVPRKRPHWAI